MNSFRRATVLYSLHTFRHLSSVWSFFKYLNLTIKFLRNIKRLKFLLSTLTHCACPLVAISCICLAEMMASSFSSSRNRFYNTTYKHAFTYKELWGRTLSFSQVFPLSDQILIFLGHCLPDLRHRHWVFSAKGS